MAQKSKYKVIFGSESFIIEATRKEVKSETGQIFFFDGSMCNHVIPAAALILNVSDDYLLIDEFEQIKNDWKLRSRELIQELSQPNPSNAEFKKGHLHALGLVIEELSQKINEHKKI